MLRRNQFEDPRDYDVLVSSPEFFKKSNKPSGSLSVQLNNKYPTTKTSGASEEERLINAAAQRVLRPEKGDHVHHKNALSLIGIALDNADDAGKDRIYNLLEHNGIDIGDDIYNMINMPQAAHADHHRFTRDQGLEMQGKGTKGLAKLLKESNDIEKTLEILQDYVDYGVPLIRENIDDVMTAYYKEKADKLDIGSVVATADQMARTKAAQEYKDAYMDGLRTSIDESGEGDNRAKAMVFKNEGDVIIEGSPRLNGNGRNGH